ncbi:MAG: flagellar basal-body MS-ring/collar protein FliF, partial [Gaiella sp.]
SRPSWVTIASGMEASEGAQVAQTLEGAGVVYELRDGGTSVVVEKGAESRARVSLANEGLPRGGHVGFEIFDKKSLGATDFQQRVDYQRALEGEIARTIESVDGVQGAEVQLVLPEKSLFLDEGTKASAAVLVNGGTGLDGSAVGGIARLVSSSVEGLKTESVTITDETGNLLWPNGSGPGGDSLTAQLEAEQRFSTQLSSQINALLASTLGAGKGQARVSADLDLDRKTVDAVTYGKTPIALNQRKDSETLATEGSAPNGPAGTAANTPTYAGNGAAGGKSQYEKTSDSTDFGVDKQVTTTVVAPGAVKRLNVALLVDKSVPAKTLEALQTSVAGMAGIDAKRGDTISVSQIEFAKVEKEPVISAPGMLDQLGGPLGAARYVGVGLGTIIFLFVIRRGLKRREGEALGPEPTWLREITEAQSLGQLESSVQRQLDPAVAKRDEFGNQVDEIVRRQPDQVAIQVKQWMNE